MLSQNNSKDVFTTFMAHSVGPVWRGASGTIDPWTKALIVNCAANQRITAAKLSGNICCSCYHKVHCEVCGIATSSLQKNSKSSMEPSDFFCGVKTSLSKFETSVKSAFGSGSTASTTKNGIVYLAIAVVILFFVFRYIDR